MEEVIAAGRTEWIPLAEPVPIHIVYWTAWVDDEGQLQLRKGRPRSPPPDVAISTGSDRADLRASREGTMTIRMRRIGSWVAFAAGFALAREAGAVTCKEWTRLSAEERTPTVEAMIEERLQSNEGRKYKVSRTALRRCLLDRIATIENSFDDVCDDSGAGMQALNDALRTHIYDCVGDQ